MQARRGWLGVVALAATLMVAAGCGSSNVELDDLARVRAQPRARAPRRPRRRRPRPAAAAPARRR